MRTGILTLTSLIALGLAACGGSHARPVAAPPAGPSAVDRTFQADAETFYWAYFGRFPVQGAGLGYHQYDGQLPDRSAAGLAATQSLLEQAEQRFTAVPAAQLGEQSRVEREVLLSVIRGRLFDLTVRHLAQRAPASYLFDIDLAGYITRDYAPLAARARALIQLAAAVHASLAAAQANLEPKLARPQLMFAIMMTGGLQAFLGKDMPAAMAKLDDADLAKQLQTALMAMSADLGAYKDFLTAHLAGAGDDFALGQADFLRMLAETEGIHTDLASLKQLGVDDLARNTAALDAAAKQIDAGKTTAEVVAQVVGQKPEPGAVMGIATEQLAAMRQFVIDHQIATVPSDERAEAAPSPSFMRQNMAFMRSAGPFEKLPLPSFYYVSPPDPSWPPAEQRAYLPSQDRLLFLTIHEVWPGHFLAHLDVERSPSKILKSFQSYAMSEGWAHYCEEMMWDEGAAGRDPRTHIAQLLEALLRDVRFLSAIGLHTEGMTLDQSIAMFQDKAFADAATARQQAMRGTLDPMYLSYTLGKLMIRQLRSDWMAKTHGTLAAFHDAFLAHGNPPLPVLRAVLMGQAAPRGTALAALAKER